MIRTGMTLAQATFQCDPDDPRHGTTHGYRNLKCRCTSCRSAHAAHQARYRQRVDAADAPHGTVGGYTNYGCRCRPCTDAVVATTRSWRAWRAAS